MKARNLSALLALLTAAPALAADWPQLLGPTRDGVVAQAPAGQPVEPEPVWDRSLGTGFAGPAVAQGKLIIAHRLADDLLVEAVDAATGVLLWTFKRPTNYVDGFGFDNGPRGVPAIAEGRVFVHGADGILDALDLATGQALWQVDTVAVFDSPQGYFGRACSPLVHEGKVILTPGGQAGGQPAGVVALDAATGRTLWQSVADEAGYASPLALDSQRLLCWMRNDLWLLQASDGAVLAHRRLRASMDASVNAAQPVLLDASRSRVALSAGYGVGLHVLSLPDLKPVWTQENLLDCHYGTPIRLGSRLYGFDGRQEMGQTLRCIDLEKKDALWQSDTVPGGTLIRVGDDHLLAVTEQGELWVVSTSPAELDIRHRVQILRSGHRSHPAFADGLLFARDGHQLVAVRVFAP
jgi:outer membrane protein assembly factor BamB